MFIDITGQLVCDKNAWISADVSWEPGSVAPGEYPTLLLSPLPNLSYQIIFWHIRHPPPPVSYRIILERPLIDEHPVLHCVTNYHKRSWWIQPWQSGNIQMVRHIRHIRKAYRNTSHAFQISFLLNIFRENFFKSSLTLQIIHLSSESYQYWSALM